MKKFLQCVLFFSGALVCSENAIAQDWQIIEKGLQAKPTAYTANGDTLVVSFNYSADKITTDSIRFGKWDGHTWSFLPSIKVNDSPIIPNTAYAKPRVLDMIYYRGELFSILRNLGSMDNDFSIRDYSVLRYHAGNWQKAGVVKVKKGTEFLKFVVINGNLNLAGNFSKVDSDETGPLAQWNGASWNSVSPITANELDGDIFDVLSNNASIYFAYTQGGKYSIKEWNGQKFNAIPSPTFLSIQNLMYMDRLCIYGFDSVESKYKIFGQASSGWENVLPRYITEFQLSDGLSRAWAYYNKSLMAVGRFTSKASSGNVLMYDGNEWKITQHNEFEADSIFQFNQKVIGFTHYIEDSNYIAKLPFSMGRISGFVYKDKNPDCLFGPGDLGLKNNLLRILPGPHYVTTDENGHFDIILPSDSYTVQPILPKWYGLNTCSNSSFGIRLLTNIDTNYTIGFAPLAPVKDLSIKVIGSSSGMRGRQGYTEDYNIICTNPGTEKVTNARIILHLSSSLNLVSSYPGVSILSPGTLAWDIKELEPDGIFRVKLQLEIPTNVPLASDLSFSVMAEDPEDGDVRNNKDSLTQLVSVALDPNDKQCSVDSIFTKSNASLTFQIRFQNPGTEPTHKVVILDTIDTHISIERIDIDGWSHPYRMKVLGSNVLQFTFENINLPQKEANPSASQGYIHYTMSLPADLPIGSVVKNTADIYFDFLPSIRTNTTVSKLVDYDAINEPVQKLKSTEWLVYPNPATNQVRIQLNGYNGVQHKIEIINIMGASVIVEKTKARDITLNTEALPDGIYLLRLDDGIVVNKLIIRR